MSQESEPQRVGSQPKLAVSRCHELPHGLDDPGEGAVVVMSTEQASRFQLGRPRSKVGFHGLVAVVSIQKPRSLLG